MHRSKQNKNKQVSVSSWRAKNGTKDPKEGTDAGPK